MDFCTKMNYLPVPATTENLCRYTAWLSLRLKPSSVAQYLNVVRLLHVESGLQNPLSENWFLKSLLKGIKRDKGQSVNRKLPITIDILQSIVKVLNLRISLHLTFWTACLIAFFGMMRKSSLFPRQGVSSFLCLRDCEVHSWGISIFARYSKTIQCQERRAFISLPWHSDPLLCPSRMLLRSLAVSNCSDQSEFLFTYCEQGRKSRLSYVTFTAMLKSVLQKLSLPLKLYSGHSFRRGGATHALMRGVPAEVIKEQGDWRSLAYLDYLELSDQHDRAKLLQPMVH